MKTTETKTTDRNQTMISVKNEKGPKKRVRRQRKVAKPKRPSKSLASLGKIAKAHRWLAMATFKPRETVDEISSNDCQCFLLGLLRRELRGMGIQFLLVREFGTGQGEGESGNRSHFHAVFSAQLPENTKARIKNLFLRRCGLTKHQSREFDYKNHTRAGDPTFGNYVSKLKKGKIDVIHPPSHWNFKLLKRPYHAGFLKEIFPENHSNLLLM